MARLSWGRLAALAFAWNAFPGAAWACYCGTVHPWVRLPTSELPRNASFVAYAYLHPGDWQRASVTVLTGRGKPAGVSAPRLPNFSPDAFLVSGAVRPGTYTIQVGAPGGRKVEGTVRVGEGRDTRPPSWDPPGTWGLTLPHPDDPCRDPEGRRVEVDVGVVSDDQALRADVLFGVWYGSPGVAIDFAAPPQGIIPSVVWKGKELLLIGAVTACEPFFGSVAVPSRIGIRARDLAGNYSEPLVIDLPEAVAP